MKFAILSVLVPLFVLHCRAQNLLECHYYSNAEDSRIPPSVAPCDFGVQHCLTMKGDNGYTVKGCAAPVYQRMCAELFTRGAAFRNLEIHLCSGNRCNSAGKERLGFSVLATVILVFVKSIF